MQIKPCLLGLWGLDREILVLSRCTLSTPGGDGRNISFEALLLGAVSTGSQLDESVKWNLHPGTLLLGHIHEVGINATKDGLVGDDDDILRALQFHDDGFETDDDVAVGLAAAVTIVILVLVASLEVLRVLFSDLLVGEAVADARVQFIQSLPFQLVVAGCGLEVAGALNGALEGGGPNDDLGVFWDTRLPQQLGKSAGICLAALRDVGITSDGSAQVELGFSVLCQVRWSSEVGIWGWQFPLTRESQMERGLMCRF